MKKFFIIIAFIILCAVGPSCNCAGSSTVSSIALKNYSADAPIETSIGNFSYADRYIIVTYEDGSTEEVPLDETMISETDKLKFYIEGSHKLSISYEGAVTEMSVNVARKTFASSVVLNDLTVVYTGEPFTVEVEGNVPSGTKIMYPQGNVFTSAGVYDMTAVLQCDGYQSKSLSAKVTIQKASYDVSNALLSNKTVAYNQEYHNITINQGQLPSGVSVSYTITKIKDSNGVILPTQVTTEGNRAMDAGVYEVRAKYKGDLANHNPIIDSVAYLTIERANVNMAGVLMQDVTYLYTGETFSLSLSDPSATPNKVIVTYEILREKDGSGKPINDSYKPGNSAINAGTYRVKAKFAVKAEYALNYVASPSEITAELKIEQANYDEIMKNVFLDYVELDYASDNQYTIALDGILPYGVTPIFTIKDANGKVLEGLRNGSRYIFIAEEIGTYTCVVDFVHNNNNYEEIDSLSTSIFIIKAND